MTLYRGDNLEAFDGSPIKIDIKLKPGETMPVVTKAVFTINNNDIIKIFENPEFPLYVGLDEKETLRLKSMNIGRLILYDIEGRKKTLDKELKFRCLPEVYHEG